jgi:dTDP-glucose 4,6-dehydratase
MKKKFLITGITGFAGPNLAKLLLSKGHEVHGVIRCPNGRQTDLLDLLTLDEYNSITFHNLDLRVYHSVHKLFTNYKFDGVFHLAAQSHPPTSFADPILTFEENVTASMNIITILENTGTKLMFCSTSEVYGTAKYTPIDESHPLQGQSPYSASKISADKIAESFYLSFGAPISVIRPFNTFGPRQSTRAIIPSVVTQLLSQNKQAQLGDPSPLRDFLHVSDTVEGFLLAGISTSIFGEVINLCSGEEHSMLEVATSCAEQLGLDPITSLVWDTDSRLRPEKSEVRQLIGSNAKALKLLGWKPKTNFSQGLANAVEWFKNPENLKNYRSDLHL